MSTQSTEPAPPVIGITMGDPAGIGPEIIARALSQPGLRRRARFVIYGISEQLRIDADSAGIEPCWHRISHDAPRAQRTICQDCVVLDHSEFEPHSGRTHAPSREGGIASKQFVEAAIADAQLPTGSPRRIDAIVTAPICKMSWQMAGYRWPGHTELLAHRTGTRRFAMLFVSPRLRVALATIHVPLSRITDHLTIGAIHTPIDLGHQACLELGIRHPRIAVAGLNPHAGEGSALGDEESRLIQPAIELARHAGIDVEGPFPADTVFRRGVDGDFDLVVAMYHDQGLIPIKILDWERSVNWTVGLPIIRTSPDHGTAFDIAGTGRASADSLVASIELAIELACTRQASLSRNEQRVASR